MAMLVLPDVFERTWGRRTPRRGGVSPCVGHCQLTLALSNPDCGQLRGLREPDTTEEPSGERGRKGLAGPVAPVLLGTHRDGHSHLRWLVGGHRHVRRGQPRGALAAE